MDKLFVMNKQGSKFYKRFNIVQILVAIIFFSFFFYAQKHPESSTYRFFIDTGFAGWLKK